MLSLLWTICLVVNANAQGSGIQDDTVLQNTYRDMKELNSGLKRDFELERLAQSVEGCVNNIDQLKRTNKIVLEDRGQFEAIFSCALPGCIEGQSWSRNDPLGAWRAFRTITGQYGQILDKNNKYVGCSATKNDPGVCLWCYLSKNPGQNRQEEDNTGNNQEDCQDYDDIDIGNIGGRTIVICQNGKENGNDQKKPSYQNPIPINKGTDITNNGGKVLGDFFQCSWGSIPISLRCDGTNNCGDNSDEEGCTPAKSLCIKPEIVAAKVDVISKSDDVMLIKVTCYSEYILDGSKFLKCQEGFWSYDFPICTRIPSGPIVRNSGLWKPDGRKGECGRPIYPRANIDKLIKTVENFDELAYGIGKKNEEGYLGFHGKRTKREKGYSGFDSVYAYVGGYDAPFAIYPWMALLGYDPPQVQGSELFYLCGGSLINKHYVLTAAHCIDTENGYPIEVVLGEHDFGTDEDCDSFGFCSAPIIRRQINVDRDVIIHENFDKRGNLEYDIALIRIEEAVTLHQENEFKSSISPICLPWNINLDYETQDDQIATGAGWGRTVGRATKNSLRNVLNNNINVNILQVLDLPIANKKCKNIDPEIQLCAGGEAGKDSCNGDSGGPLMVFKNDGGIHGVAFQIGLVSFGTKTCAVGIPGVYTKVTKFLPWISKNLKA